RGDLRRGRPRRRDGADARRARRPRPRPQLAAQAPAPRRARRRAAHHHQRQGRQGRRPPPRPTGDRAAALTATYPGPPLVTGPSPTAPVGHRPGSSAVSAASTRRATSLREVTPSLTKMLRRWVSTVLGLT